MTINDARYFGMKGFLMKKYPAIILNACEIFLFGIPFFLIIPAPPSNEISRADQLEFFPDKLIAILFFALSRLLAWKVRRESVWISIIYTAIFAIFVWILNQCLGMW